jgi:hypothetical protein
MALQQNKSLQEPKGWRAAYTKQLIASGLSEGEASAYAAKVVYNPNLLNPPAPAQSQELPLFELTSSTPAISRKSERIIKASAEIAMEGAEGDDRMYMHSILCQVGLPRSSVAGTSFERRSGGAALLVEAGKLWNGKDFIQQPIPYGGMPRLMLAWMNTYAVKSGSPEIPVGDSASEFLRMLGQEPSGGKRGSYTTFKKQIMALSACRMTLGFNYNGQAHTYEGKPIKHFAAWIAETDEQKPLWPGAVTFSQEYFETLINHAVPIDFRALSAIKGSALAMDVYMWLAQRLYRIEGRPVILHWKSLREQFGQEYQGKNADKDFKKVFLTALKAALAVYPQAKVKTVTGGIMMMASPPPISFKG